MRCAVRLALLVSVTPALELLLRAKSWRTGMDLWQLPDLVARRKAAGAKSARGCMSQVRRARRIREPLRRLHHCGEPLAVLQPGAAPRFCGSDSVPYYMLMLEKPRGNRLSPRPSPLRDHFIGSGQERSGMVRPSALRS